MKPWNLSWDQDASKVIYRSCWFTPETAWVSHSTAGSSVQQNRELVVNTFYSNNLKCPYTIDWAVWSCWSSQSSISNKNNNPFLLWSHCMFLPFILQHYSVRHTTARFSLIPFLLVAAWVITPLNVLARRSLRFQWALLGPRFNSHHLPDLMPLGFLWSSDFC